MTESVIGVSRSPRRSATARWSSTRLPRNGRPGSARGANSACPESSASPSTICRGTRCESRAASAADRMQGRWPTGRLPAHLSLVACADAAIALCRRPLRGDEQEPTEDEQQQVAGHDQRDRCPCARSSLPLMTLALGRCVGRGDATTRERRRAGAPLIAALMLNCTSTAPPLEPAEAPGRARERHIR